MARIDNDGINEINEKIKNPLEHMYNKLEKKKIFNDFKDEFDFIYRFLEDINYKWEKIDGDSPSISPTVIVDGKEYSPTGG